MMRLLDITTIWILAQQPTQGASGAAGETGGWSTVLSNPINFLMLALILLWFMVILPQQRQGRDQQRKTAEALAGLKKNDHVVTMGGIHGVVVNSASDSPTVTIRIDDSNNTKITVNRDAITRVISDATT